MRYDIYRARLLQWGDELGLLGQNPRERDPRLDREDLRPLLERALNSIKMMLDDVDGLKSKYRLQEVHSLGNRGSSMSVVNIGEQRLQVQDFLQLFFGQDQESPKAGHVLDSVGNRRRGLFPHATTRSGCHEQRSVSSRPYKNHLPEADDRKRQTSSPNFSSRYNNHVSAFSATIPPPAVNHDTRAPQNTHTRPGSSISIMSMLGSEPERPQQQSQS
jgi:hypothetical protein